MSSLITTKKFVAREMTFRDRQKKNSNFCLTTCAILTDSWGVNFAACEFTLRGETAVSEPPFPAIFHVFSTLPNPIFPVNYFIFLSRCESCT